MTSELFWIGKSSFPWNAECICIPSNRDLVLEWVLWKLNAVVMCRTCEQLVVLCFSTTENILRSNNYGPVSVPLEWRASRSTGKSHCAWANILPRMSGRRLAVASSHCRRLHVWSTGGRLALVLCWAANWRSQARRSRSQAPLCWAVLWSARTIASCPPR